VNRLVDIVNDMGLDGVDIDCEYFYDNHQNDEAIHGNFDKGAEAIAFLRKVTLGLWQSLPKGSLVNHAPMEPDNTRGTAYFELLKELGPSLDDVLPQYYNSVLRPHKYGLVGKGNGSDDTSQEYSTLDHYRNIVTDIVSGDATRVVFGFCLSQCPGNPTRRRPTFSATAVQAARVMTELKEHYPCHGGAYFWTASMDGANATWSSTVNDIVQQTAGCSSWFDFHAKEQAARI
jgi:hypothetical protein